MQKSRKSAILSIIMTEFKKDLIYEHLKREILDRTFYPGMRLPTEKILARRLNIGQVTLRSALARLEAEKLVKRIPGKGTFVNEALQNHTFLLVLPDGTETLESPSRYIAEGISAAAEKHTVIIERCPASLLMSFSIEECQAMIERNRISGVILESGHAKIDPALAKRIASFNLPTVVPHGLPGDAEQTGFLIMRTDERSAFSDGLLALRNAGHKRIAFLRLDLPTENLASIRGFTKSELLEFYKNNQLDADEKLLATVHNSQSEIDAAVKGWLALPEPVTAIICHSDRIAMRVMRTLKDLDITIPEQLSIMGYSNYPGSQLMTPALTTIDIQFSECGKIALEQLLKSETWFKSGTVPAEIFTPYELLMRDSITSPR